MPVKFLIFFSLVITSCATAGKYESILKSWVGKPSDKLVEKWGAPTSTYTKQNGDRIITYFQTTGSSTIGSVQNHRNPQYGTFIGSSTTYTCKTDFTVDTQGHIKSWRWEGHACRSR